MPKQFARAALVCAGLFTGLASSTLAAEQPIRVILVGDSTMAPRTGYGDALCARLTPEVNCLNLARGGRSSGSFRAEGLWANVQALLRDGKAPGASYVLIQFGHNDQPGKPGRSTDLVHDFPANLSRYVDEVKAAGGIPVLLTPLTRRSFKGPWLHNDLAPWSAVTRQVAQQKQVPLLDLNALSHAAVQAMGEDEADTLAMVPKPPAAPVSTDPNQVEPAGAAKTAFDRTHLGDKGARLFARMVVDEWLRLQPELAAQFKTDK